MSESFSFPASPPSSERVLFTGSRRQLGLELRQLLQQLQTSPPSAQAALRLLLRERLELTRTALLGPHVRLPASLRHAAISLTEVQWLLDAWIAGGGDASEEAMLQQDFFQAAARLIGEIDQTQQPLAGKPEGFLRGAWRALRQRWLAGNVLLQRRMIGKPLGRTS